MKHSGGVHTGLITASYGKRGILRDAAGNDHRYLLKGRKLRAVCGDTVDWQVTSAGDEVLVTDIQPRRNVLERPDSRGKAETLAANLTQLLIVLAPLPEPDYFLADRYLCAASIMGADASIIWNKTDIASELPAELVEYKTLGYPLSCCSATQERDIEEIAEALTDGVSMLVGQSGVGKSSLINRLIPDAQAAVGALSEANREGRHTTTASLMHWTRGGGKVIDSPGVREFAPIIRDASQIQTGYVEILARADACRFADCQHLREPDCAVKLACEQGEISARRYESYKRLHNTVAALN